MKLSQILSESPIVSFTELNRSNEEESDSAGGAMSDVVDGNDQVPPNEDNAQVESDPNKAGTIRTVPHAHLVYKRQNELNTFTELWIYKKDVTSKKQDDVYTAILAGTDIPKLAKASADGEQTVSTWEIGQPKNMLVYVEINGLSN